MTGLTQATAAGFERYGVMWYPLTLNDYGEFDAWLGATFREEAIQQLDIVDDRHRESYMRCMLQVSAGLTLSSEAGKVRLRSIEGSLKIMELSCRKAKTVDEIRAIMTDHADDEDAHSEIAEFLTELLSVEYGEKSDGGGEGGNPTEPAQ
jgi:hypothetical protein